MWVLEEGGGCFVMSHLKHGVHLWQTIMRGHEFLAWIKGGLVTVILAFVPLFTQGEWGEVVADELSIDHGPRSLPSSLYSFLCRVVMRPNGSGLPLCLTQVDWNVVIGESRGSLRWCLGWPFNQFIYCTTNAYMRNRSAFNLHCGKLPASSSSKHSAVCSLSQCFFEKY